MLAARAECLSVSPARPNCPLMSLFSAQLATQTTNLDLAQTEKLTDTHGRWSARARTGLQAGHSLTALWDAWQPPSQQPHTASSSLAWPWLPPALLLRAACAARTLSAKSKVTKFCAKRRTDVTLFLTHTAHCLPAHCLPGGAPAAALLASKQQRGATATPTQQPPCLAPCLAAPVAERAGRICERLARRSFAADALAHANGPQWPPPPECRLSACWGPTSPG